ncbi:hypothetical protein ACFRCI_36300 [Streptomyces sp. NPDC056638]
MTMAASPIRTTPAHIGGHIREPGATTTFAPLDGQNSTGVSASSTHSSRA